MSKQEAYDFFCRLLENNSKIANKKQELLNQHTSSQKPKVALITCSDSRIPLALYGDLKDIMGNVFVGKDIGNTSLDSDAVINYAIQHLKIPVVVILGHTDCGAVKSAAENFDNETDAIKKRLTTIKNTFTNTDDHIKCVENNVNDSVEKITKQYAQNIDSNSLCVVGCVCDTSGAYNKNKCSATYIININGQKDKQTLGSHELIKNITNSKLKETIFTK